MTQIKKKNVVLGETYFAKVSGQRVRVKIIKESAFGGWDAMNLTTKRWIRIKTAARLSYASLPKETSTLTRLSEMAKAAHQVVNEEKIFNGPMATEVKQ